MARYNWSNQGGSPVRGAARNGVRWNAAEERDLKHEWVDRVTRLGQTASCTIMQLAAIHQRLINAIELRLFRIYDAETVDSLYNKTCWIKYKSAHDGIVAADARRMASMSSNGVHHDPAGQDAWSGARDANLDRKVSWTSQDGRCLFVHEMDLDHLLNVVHDCNFRVAAMRKHAMQTLGGAKNPNLNAKTTGAFATVNPGDVYPAWREIVEWTKRRFHGQFGVTIHATRQMVYRAWETREPIPVQYMAAVEFCLTAGRKEPLRAPPRLTGYLASFAIDSDEAFRTMCWNLRLDQPACWKIVSADATMLKRIKRVPFLRLNSALNFEPVHSPASDMIDDWSEFE